MSIFWGKNKSVYHTAAESQLKDARNMKNQMCLLEDGRDFMPKPGACGDSVANRERSGLKSAFLTSSTREDRQIICLYVTK